MLNMNFVPDDYIQSSESRRTNLTYLVLFAAVMATLGGSFMTIKIRQRALATKENLVNAKMAQAQQAIEQFEQLQTKRKMMLKTALTTAELIEPVPRSVLLATLTNNLPTGVSLLRLNLVQKEPKKINQAVSTSKYRNAQVEKAAETQPKLSPEKLLETYMDIEGIAPSDLQVAAYIKRLDSSSLLDNVALVESKEHKSEDSVLRQFKLTAMLKEDVHLTNEDIASLRMKD
jgi:hypothetical protein